MITARRQILRALLEPPDAAAGNLKSALPSGSCFRHEAETFSDNFRLAAACRALQLVKDFAILRAEAGVDVCFHPLNVAQKVKSVLQHLLTEPLAASGVKPDGTKLLTRHSLLVLTH